MLGEKVPKKRTLEGGYNWVRLETRCHQLHANILFLAQQLIFKGMFHEDFLSLDGDTKGTSLVMSQSKLIHLFKTLFT